MESKIFGCFGQSVIYLPSTEYNIFHLQISKHQAYNFLCDRNKYDNNLGKNMDSKGYKYGSQDKNQSLVYIHGLQKHIL